MSDRYMLLKTLICIMYGTMRQRQSVVGRDRRDPVAVLDSIFVHFIPSVEEAVNNDIYAYIYHKVIAESTKGGGEES